MNTRVEWREVAKKRCLLLQFNGHFSAEEAQSAISHLSALLKGEAAKVTMVWECSGMGGFDAAARDAWARFMRDTRSKIEKIHLVSNKMLIRTGAMVVGIVAGIKIVPWSTMAEVNT